MSRKLNELIGFIKTITHRLINDDVPADLVEDIRATIATLPLSSNNTDRAIADGEGTNLWNLVTRLSRPAEATDDEHIGDSGSVTLASPKSRSTTLCLLRVLASMLLDSGSTDRTASFRKAVRVLKVAVKAARICLGLDEIPLAARVAERAASCVSVLDGRADSGNAEQEKVLKRLRDDYYVLRVILAWKQHNLDVAEHMYRKISPKHDEADPATTENLADALFEIGKDLYEHNLPAKATHWLGRAYDLLSLPREAVSYDNISDLKLSVGCILVKALASTKAKEATERADSIITSLEAEFPGRISVGLLKLELTEGQNNEDVQGIAQVLLNMVHTVHLTESTVKTLLYHVNKLRNRSGRLACTVLDEFIKTRLSSDPNLDWLEKATALRIWASVSTSFEAVESELESLLDTVLSVAKTSFTSTGTQAAQTLMWRQVEDATSTDHHEAVEKWCRLCLHPLFAEMSEQNRATIERRMIMSAMAQADFAKARAHYSNMSDYGRAAPQTCYLMYKVALSLTDDNLAGTCLESIYKNASKEPDLLFACVLEAQRSGNKFQAITALQRVLDYSDENGNRDIHLPALIRCMLKLLFSEIASDSIPGDEMLNAISRLFAVAALHSSDLNHPEGASGSKFQFDDKELKWFANNSFNLALEFCDRLHPSHVAALATHAFKLLSTLKSRHESQAGDRATFDLPLVFAGFLVVTANVVLARLAPDQDSLTQYYHLAQTQAGAGRSLVSQFLLTASATDATRKDLTDKFFELIKYELEACLCLEQWENLETLFQECWRYDDPHHWKTLADLAIIVCEQTQSQLEASGQGNDDAGARRMQHCREKTLEFLGTMINKISTMSTSTGETCKWLRCLFQLLTTPGTSSSADDAFALQIITQAASIAASCNVAQHPGERFPPVELEYLATSAFNRAVDFFNAGNDEMAGAWAEKALALAKEADDGGVLARELGRARDGLVQPE